jgi:hypothetical protein
MLGVRCSTFRPFSPLEGSLFRPGGFSYEIWAIKSNPYYPKKLRQLNRSCLGTYFPVGPIRNKAKGRGMDGIP